MHHYALGANGAKRKFAATTALGIAAAAGLCATNQAAGQAVTNFFPPTDIPLGTVDRMGVKEIHTGPQSGTGAGNPQFNSYNDVHTALMNPNPTATWRIARYETQVLNIWDSPSGAGQGNFTANQVDFGVKRAGATLVNGTASVATGNIEDVGLVARGVLRVLPNQNGVHTFGVNSDDGFALAFPLENGGYRTWVSANGSNDTSLTTYNGTANGALRVGNRGTADSFGRIDLPVGDHPFILSFNERGGGDAVEFFLARGAKTEFAQGGFRLVGDGPFTDIRGRKYAGTVQGNGWNVREIHSPGGLYDRSAVPARTAAQDPTANLAATIATYQNIRTGGAPPPGYTGGPSLTQGVVFSYETFLRNGTRALNVADVEPNFGEINPGAVRQPYSVLEMNRQAQGANNYYGIGARATVAIDTASIYTFGVLSDDSFRFRVLNSTTGVPVPIISSNGVNGLVVQNVDTPSDAGATDGTPDAFQSTNCCNDGFGRYQLAAGTYTLEVVMNEMTGGSSLGVYGLIGDWNAFNPGFQLVGENINDPNFLIQEGGPQLVARAAVTWRGATNANWNNGGNWTFSQEPTAIQDVVFPAAIPATGANITVPNNTTVKSLAVNGGYTFTGGSLIVNGNISVAAGQTATLNTTVTTNGLQGPGSVAVGGTTQIRTRATGGTGTSTVGGLTIAGARGAWTGKLDVTNNDVQINNTGANVLGDVADQVKSGYANGAWTGNGITSSTLQTAYAANDRSRSLGFNTNATGTLVKYTFTGDANLDAAVNGSDFALLAGNFGRPGLWPQGDFNYDGTINGSDFALLAGNFGKQGNPAALTVTTSDWLALEAFGASIGVATPEPTALGLVALGSLGLLARRRRKA